MKKFLLILLAIIFAPIWLLIILGHFITYPIVQRKIKKERKKNKYWNERVYKSDRCQIFLTRSHDLMVAFHHYYDELDYDDDERKYAKEVSIHFGGLHLFWKWGKKFLTKDDKYEDSKTKYYGLYCIDGWHGYFWDMIWLGKWGLHDVPFKRNKHVGTYIYDLNKLEFVNQINTDSYRCSNPVPYPYVKIIKDDYYMDKNGDTQHINEIRWSLVERRYENPILKWLGIGHLFQKRYIDLEFDSDSEMGIKTGSWKGGVMGSSIKINKENEPDIYSVYNNIIKGHVNLVNKLKFLLDNRINRFLHEDKLY